VLIIVLRVSRSCAIFPDGFDLHLLQLGLITSSGALAWHARDDAGSKFGNWGLELTMWVCYANMKK